jgi:ribosomal protein S12 methylthiotransferase
VKAGFISLGCSKNLVDTEMMLGILKEHGIEITPDPAEADILVVNTCAFIQSAKEESITTILVTHYVEEALYLGGQIAVMDGGGKISELIDNPAGDSLLRRSDEKFFRLGRELRHKLRPEAVKQGGEGR